jgi:hypothetical protein
MGFNSAFKGLMNSNNIRLLHGNLKKIPLQAWTGLEVSGI